METAYEAIYIIEAGLPDEQSVSIIDKYQGVVTRGGGVIDDVDRWDARRLAYPVKGRREGVYIVMNFRSEPAARLELDRIFRISDDVIRHMIIRQEDEADRFPSKIRAAEQERREREMAARAAAAPPPVEKQPITDLSDSSEDEDESPATDFDQEDAETAESSEPDDSAVANV